MNIVVLEGPSVQNIYQQVIRDFPGLVGAGWESRRRQVYPSDQYLSDWLRETRTKTAAKKGNILDLLQLV